MLNIGINSVVNLRPINDPKCMLPKNPQIKKECLFKVLASEERAKTVRFNLD